MLDFCMVVVRDWRVGALMEVHESGRLWCSHHSGEHPLQVAMVYIYLNQFVSQTV